MAHTESNTARGLGYVLLTAAYAVYLLRLRTAGVVYTLWTDRDLVRAETPWTEGLLGGAELSYGEGARVPGWDLYPLIAALSALGDTVEALWRAQMFLDGLALGPLCVVLAKRWGLLPAGLAAAAWVGSAPWLETLGVFWNAGLTPLFTTAGLLLAVLAARTGRVAPLAAAGLVGGLGTQLHLSVALVVGAGVLAALPALGRSWWKGLTASLGAALASLAPHLVAEALHGAPNTRLLLAQPEARALAGSPLAPVEPWRLVEAAGHLLPLGALWHDAPLLSGLAALGLGGLGLSGIGLTLRDREGEDLVVLASLLLPWLLLALDPALDGSVRYFLVLLPPWAWMVARGTSVAARARPTAVLVGLLALAALTARADHLVHHPKGGPGEDARLLLTRAAHHLRTDPRTLAGRLVVVRDEADGWTWRAELPLAAWLAERGRAQTGSLSPPCMAQVPTIAEDPERALREALGDAVTRVRVLETLPLDAHAVLLRYDPGGAWCPTSFANRYVPLPAEEALWALPRGTPGDVVTLPAEDGALRVAVAWDPGEVPGRDTAWLGVDLVPSGAGASARLVANDLRGFAFYGGRFAQHRIARPTIVLEDGERTHEIPLADGPVGYQAVIAPLVLDDVPVPQGRWSARLRFDEVPLVEQRPVRPGPPRPREVTLPGVLVVP